MLGLAASGALAATALAPTPAPDSFTCTISTDGEMRFLALGDSYTIGESVPEGDRWPVQLADLLRGAGVPIDAPEIIARSGWTTGDLTRAMERADLQGPYELVTLLIGVNNQYQRRGIDEYRAEFGALLDEAIELAGGHAGRVVVLSIPDWGVTPFAVRVGRADVSGEIARFNAAARLMTEDRGARWVDVTSVSREAAVDVTLLATDGLHPSGTMYAAWARLAYEDACSALTGNRENRSADE
jgi:lysophospholipase L1-like esterase